MQAHLLTALLVDRGRRARGRGCARAKIWRVGLVGLRDGAAHERRVQRERPPAPIAQLGHAAEPGRVATRRQRRQVFGFWLLLLGGKLLLRGPWAVRLKGEVFELYEKW